MNVDWSKAPEGATEIVHANNELRWANKSATYFSHEDDARDGWHARAWAGWKTIANRPTEQPRKTVKDAVEYYDRKWPEDADVIVYAEYSEGWRFCGWISDWRWHTGEAYEVCTRAEFEAEVEREKGEGWTHYVEDDVNPPTKCKKHLKLVGEEDDWVYVCEKGEYFVPAKMGFCSVRPIKPNISKAECDAVMSFASKFGLVDKAETYLNNHTVQEHQS